jgi:EmrB/QacA subfamily drug resistance transporter
LLGGQAKPCDPGVALGARARDDCLERAKPWVLAATIAASGMAFIDGTIVDIVLPVIGTEFEAGLAELQWVINAYVLLNAALALIGGSAGDLFGRRRIFEAGIVVFAIGSVGCGLAPSIEGLVIARIIQGVGCAMMVPNSLAIIGASFSEAERGKAIGIWAGATSIAGVIAPAFGGWLADMFSWRAIFFINIPLAAITLAITVRHMPQSRAESAPARLDWLGAALAACGLGAVTFALIRVGASGWRQIGTITALAAGIAMLVAFVIVEARSKAPMVPLGLFRLRAFSGVNVMTLLLYAALSGAFFFVPFDLIRVQGYSAAQAGAAFLPFPLIMAALSRWSGGIIDRFGATLPLVLGPIVTAAGFALLARTGTGAHYWTDFFPAMVALGLGMAITVAPLTTVVINSVPEANIGVASGVNNAVTDISTLFAIGAFGAIGLVIFGNAMDASLAGTVLSPELANAVQAIKDTLAGAPPAAGLSAADRALVTAATGTAFVAGFRVVMIGATALALASALVAALTIGRQPRAAPALDTKTGP